MRTNRGKIDETLAAMFSNIKYSNDYLFYAHMIGQCSIKIDEKLPAPAGVSYQIDHFNLHINPKLFDKEPLLHRLGILKHEMLHILYGHLKLRSKGLIFNVWNFATDCALNQHIERDHLPDYIIDPTSLSKQLNVNVPSNKSSELYYNLIKSNIPPSNSSGGGGEGDPQDGSGGTPDDGMVGDHGIWQSSQGDEELKQDITKKMIERSQEETIKSKGKVPSGCSDWLELHTRKAEVNWRKVLRGIVGNKRVGSRSTIMRNDRRFPKRSDLRGKTKDRMFNLLVVADVSGSMSDKAVLDTLAEVRHICDVTKTDVDLIQIDAQAYKPEKLSKKTKLIGRKGHGGTQLHPALDMAKRYKIDFQAVVVLTDGGLYSDECSYFRALGKKVIWLIEEQGHIMDEMNSGRMKAFKLKGSKDKS